MPVWPVAANAVRIPLARSASRICSCVVILPMLQSVPTVSTIVGIDGAHAAARHVEARGGTAQVVDRHAAGFGQRGQLRDVGDEGVQAAPDLEAVLDGARDEADPFGRQLAPAGAMPMSSAFGFSASPSSSVATTGMSPPNPMTSPAVWPARVASMTPTTRWGV
jgi:hypothetical protein